MKNITSLDIAEALEMEHAEVRDTIFKIKDECPVFGYGMHSKIDKSYYYENIEPELILAVCSWFHKPGVYFFLRMSHD